MSFRKYAARGKAKQEVKNPTAEQLKVKERDHQRVLKDRQYINHEIERRGGCEFCGVILHHSVYQWHHIWDDDPTNRPISEIAGRAGPKRLDKEFAKCVLLCPNCHSTFHQDLCCMFEHKELHINGTYHDQLLVESDKPKTSVMKFLL